MPEGDNVHAHAATLAQLLVGAPLRAVFSRGVDVRALRGRRVSAVDAVGKHLVLRFDDGAAVRVHLGLSGGWRRVGHATTEAMARADLALATEAVTLLGRARQVEWTRARLAAGTRALGRLGPDLLAEQPDLEAVVARARRPELAARPLGELLLDQSVAAGLGNIYKCELLFLHGLDPWARVDAVSDDALRALYADARRWLRANVGRPRTTTADVSRGDRPARGRGRLWVYGRWHRPCYRCGTPIAQRRQGPSRRPTWFCPRCQPSASGASAS
jgi:endonuclease-8